MLIIKSFLGVKNVKITVKFDKVELFLRNMSIEILSDFLRCSDEGSHKHKKADYEKYPNSFFSDIEKFRIDKKSITVKRLADYSVFHIIFLQPKFQTMETFSQVILKHRPDQQLVPNLAEIAFDFKTKTKADRDFLNNQNELFAFHPRKRIDSNTYVNPKDGSKTWYSSWKGKNKNRHPDDLRKGKRPPRPSRCIKAYNNFRNPEINSTRLETSLKKSILKSLKWTFPIPQKTLSNLKIYEHCRYCKFDLEGFRRKYTKSSMRFHPDKKKIESLSDLSISKFCNSLSDERIIDIIEFLKQIPDFRYHDFIIPMQEENKILQDVLSSLLNPIIPIKRKSQLIKRRKKPDAELPIDMD